MILCSFSEVHGDSTAPGNGTLAPKQSSPPAVEALAELATYFIGHHFYLETLIK